MPGDGHCLYYARRSWFAPMEPAPREAAKLVEAPGTAPGSATPIPHAVYRHSRFPGDGNMGKIPGFRNGAPGRPPLGSR
jgi:hypothetical protein